MRLYSATLQSIVFLLLFLILPLTSFSQSNEKIVAYDIDKRDFEEALPFDQPFKIKFKSSKPIKALEVKYKVAEGDPSTQEFKVKYYFQARRMDASGYVNSGVRDFSSQSFSIGDIGPLHANTSYTFEIYIYDKIAATDNATTALKADVQKFINELYTGSNVLPDPPTMRAKFVNLLSAHTPNLYDGTYNAITVEGLFSAELDNYRNDLNGAKQRIDAAATNYDAQAKAYKDNFYLSGQFCNLINSIEIKDIENSYLFNEPVNLLTAADIKLIDLVNFYKYDCNRQFTYLAAILSGEVQFGEKAELKMLPAAQKYENIKSLELIRISLILLKKLIKKSDGAQYFNAEIQDAYLDRLETMIDQSKVIIANRASLATANANVPNILLNKFTLSTFRTDYRAITDVETSATPYINLDLGLLYAPSLEGVYALQTVNFHSAPVNRNADFADLEGADEFWKRICFQIGLAQRLGPTEDRYSSFLTGDLGTPYLGFGLRCNRIFRVSAGMILYQEKSNNPVITDKVTKGAFAFTVTINSALSKALGYVGSVFNGVNK